MAEGASPGAAESAEVPPAVPQRAWEETAGGEDAKAPTAAQSGRQAPDAAAAAAAAAGGDQSAVAGDEARRTRAAVVIGAHARGALARRRAARTRAERRAEDARRLRAEALGRPSAQPKPKASPSQPSPSQPTAPDWEHTGAGSEEQGEAPDAPLEQQEAAAARIQAVQRGRLERRRLGRERQAAVAIQAVQRGRVARRDVAARRRQRRQQEQAAVRIQRAERRRQQRTQRAPEEALRKEEPLQSYDERKVALVQAAARGRTARTRFKRVREEDRAARVIQRRARTWLVGTGGRSEGQRSAAVDVPTAPQSAPASPAAPAPLSLSPVGVQLDTASPPQPMLSSTPRLKGDATPLSARSDSDLRESFDNATQTWLSDTMRGAQSPEQQDEEEGEEGPSMETSPATAEPGVEMEASAVLAPAPAERPSYLGHSEAAAAEMEDFATQLAMAFGFLPSAGNGARVQLPPQQRRQQAPSQKQQKQQKQVQGRRKSAVSFGGTDELEDASHSVVGSGSAQRARGSRRVSFGADSISSVPSRESSRRSHFKSPPPPSSSEAEVAPASASSTPSRRRLRSPPPPPPPAAEELQTVDGGTAAAMVVARAASAEQHDSDDSDMLGTPAAGAVGEILEWGSSSPERPQLPVMERIGKSYGSSDSSERAEEAPPAAAKMPQFEPELLEREEAWAPRDLHSAGSETSRHYATAELHFVQRQREMQERLAAMVARPVSGMGSRSTMAGTPRNFLDSPGAGFFSPVCSPRLSMIKDSPVQGALRPRHARRRGQSGGHGAEAVPLAEEKEEPLDEAPAAEEPPAPQPEPGSLRRRPGHARSGRGKAAAKVGREVQGAGKGAPAAAAARRRPKGARAAPAGKGASGDNGRPPKARGAAARGAAKGKGKVAPARRPAASGKENRGGGSAAGVVRQNKAQRARMEKIERFKAQERQRNANRPFRAKPAPKFMRDRARGAGAVRNELRGVSYSRQFSSAPDGSTGVGPRAGGGASRRVGVSSYAAQHKRQQTGYARGPPRRLWSRETEQGELGEAFVDEMQLPPINMRPPPQQHQMQQPLWRESRMTSTAGSEQYHSRAWEIDQHQERILREHEANIARRQEENFNRVVGH